MYIREAHAADSSWPVGYARKLKITQHKNFKERCQVAERLRKEKKLTVPFLVDDMKDTASRLYQGWPDRVYLVRSDGTLAVAGRRGPWGFRPALEQARTWLEQFRKTGKEPPPVSEPQPEKPQKAAKDEKKSQKPSRP